MDKIKEKLKGLGEKLKALSKAKKIAFSVLFIGILSGIIYLIVFFNTTKYTVLYKDMEPNDSQIVLGKLNEKKIEYKVENNTIKVPEEQVSKLRLELAPQLTGGSKGYEILDNGSAFGMTDKERNINYKRALEGELSRNIQSLPEVRKAKAILVMQEDSNFFREAEPSKASINLEFEQGKNIKKDQIKAIVSLVTGSVKNLPKENVKVVGVINGKTSDLSEDLFKDESSDISGATDKQREYEKNLEKEYEKKIIKLLAPKYGDGVKASVDVDADFDANKKKSVLFDPNKVIKSEEIQKNTSNSDGGNTSSGPVDNNMSNTYNNANGNSKSTSEKTIRNYEVGKIEEDIISAPGTIKKVAASVTVNNENLAGSEKDKINNLVSAAISYDKNRGDIISIEGMKFKGGDTAAQEAAKLAQEEANRKKMLMYKYIGAGVAGLIALLAILFALRRARKSKKNPEEIEGIDTLIGDNIEPKEPLEPINFEEDNERNHVEKEIKKYANEKPEQVSEIIKSWLNEDER